MLVWIATVYMHRLCARLKHIARLLKCPRSQHQSTHLISQGYYYPRHRTIEPQYSVLETREAMAMHNKPGLSSVGMQYQPSPTDGAAVDETRTMERLTTHRTWQVRTLAPHGTITSTSKQHYADL
jgi:hypothetical protein